MSRGDAWVVPSPPVPAGLSGQSARRKPRCGRERCCPNSGEVETFDPAEGVSEVAASDGPRPRGEAWQGPAGPGKAGGPRPGLGPREEGAVGHCFPVPRPHVAQTRAGHLAPAWTQEGRHFTTGSGTAGTGSQARHKGNRDAPGKAAVLQRGDEARLRVATVRVRCLPAGTRRSARAHAHTRTHATHARMATPRQRPVRGAWRHTGTLQAKGLSGDLEQCPAERWARLAPRPELNSLPWPTQRKSTQSPEVPRSQHFGDIHSGFSHRPWLRPF